MIPALDIISEACKRLQAELTNSFIAQPLLRFHPNVLSLVALTFALIFFLFMQLELWFWALITLFGAFFDAIDGFVARKTGRTSRFGAFFDSTLDRISDAFIFSAFGYAGIASFEIIIPLIVTSFLVSYTRAKAESLEPHSESFRLGIMERTERLVVIGIVLVVFILFPQLMVAGISFVEFAFLLLIPFNLITIWQRIALAYQKLKAGEK